ncbi:MAG TPA: hypothetical protein VNG33_14425, partial [Polyangiaceae bacterium]|nr:hypothetical protein [Polyangiaceae bacterium]
PRLAGATLALGADMKLAQPRWLSLGMRLLGPLVVLGLSGCGDDFVPFSDTAPAGAGAAGAAASGATAGKSASGGSATQAAAGSTNVVIPTAGTSSGASMLNVESSAAGAESAGEAGTGTGGAGAAGGAAGAAGAAGQPVNLPTDSFDLIDDVEGAFPHLPQREGRNGVWFGVHDDTYGQLVGPHAVALEPARGTSHFAAGINGAGFTGWGAQLGVALRSPSAAYDATSYCGLRFLAKGSGAGWTLLVSDRTSVPEGGICVDGSADPEQSCYNFVGKSFGVGQSWREIKIRFDDLRWVPNAASPRRLETDALYDIVFNFYDAQGGAFQLLVDDLSFIEKNSLDCQ